MQYWSRCNIVNLFGNALLFSYIYNGKLVKISANIAFFLILHRNLDEIFATILIPVM